MVYDSIWEIMQVATLFRESAATLLGATGMIESPTAPHSFVPPPSHPSKPPSGTEAPPYTCLDALGAHHQVLPIQDSTTYKMTLEYHHAKSIPFAQNCPLSLSPTTNKHEMPDDGYETSGGDTITPRNSLAPAKCDLQSPSEDPYNFIDDDLSHMMSFPSLYGAQVPPDFTQNLDIGATPKKRGRKKKVRDDLTITSVAPKVQRERKKHDRFNGMPEEEVSKRTLPDHLTSNLDIIIIGINPGLFAAYKGHHYAGPGNHFWKCLYLSGLTAEQMSAEEDYKLLNCGIGFTNMVERATKGSADLTRKEIKEGCRILLDKLRRFRPKIAVFNGKLIFEVFSGKKDFNFGRQPECIEGTNTYMWVMPSSSARCAQLPRAADKVPFYAALKKFRDYLNGLSPEADLEEQEFVFSDPKYKVCCESEPKTDICLPDKDDGGSGVGGIVGAQEVKKKRGRPKKVRPDDGMLQTTKTNSKRTSPLIDGGGGSDAKKKRGRPKKLKDSRGGEQQECKIQFNSPPPILEAMQQQQQHNNTGSFCKTPTAYQSPQNSQTRDTFSHSDLSSEISAAISSDHLVDSPPATSPPLGPPPDFEPPATMPTDDASHTPDLTISPYSPYNNNTSATYAHDEHWRAVREQRDVYKVPDVTTKSLSGLENLVDQIPTMGDVDVSQHHNHHHHQVINGTIEDGDAARGGDDTTNYPSCLYSDRDYESVFAPYGGASYAVFSTDSIDVPPPPPPPAYAEYTSNNFDYTYPGQHTGFGSTQVPPSPQMVLNPNYATYAPSSYPQPPYPPPQAQSSVNYRHYAFKPDITGYGTF